MRRNSVLITYGSEGVKENIEPSGTRCPRTAIEETSSLKRMQSDFKIQVQEKKSLRPNGKGTG